MIDRLDGQILHALQISPRVSFRRIAEVVGATEQTVARRYHRLRRNGVVRVVGVEHPWVDGDSDWAHWVCRLHAKPDRIPQLADALVRNPDVSHANVLSGWTDLVCTIRAPLRDSRDDVLLKRLPRASSVIDIDIDAVLHTFGRPPSAPWTGYGHKLSGEQAVQILADVDGPPAGQPSRPTLEDRPILDALADDGRAPHSRLAERTGWSVARVRRRLTALEAAGALVYDVDVLPERLGYHLSAMLWLTVAPQHTHRVGERVAAHDQVAFAAAVSGSKNLMAVVICRDVRDLYAYLSNHLGGIEEVLTYEVSIRTQRLKQHGSVIAHGRLMNPTPTRAARGSAAG
ncbi:AsnC family transcriptional regulator [Mycobacterium sp. 852002-53434_SCH5985345]|uniref:Lrp/AsnC family transcriptional regulator n=1 Tax=unclassified Mycobacterium TaxID=2642494 RepID=UPI0007FC1739|nr:MULTISPECIES: AsnC family transcriptional regulator [unclassified Mycobacterium]OBF49519.1 AsnC family transcriptional regulator [Mycobacterium sp. 852002-53434_SCH5985345]OBF71999.1 AsnC family transcriptional regulator [Mycobacterium sp. 852002-51613_SCH5001154]OBF99269.1 AsnC family transcriptional regulator [Mycobacterium sp. 852014-52450_SCH5900713]